MADDQGNVVATNPLLVGSPFPAVSTVPQVNPLVASAADAKPQIVASLPPTPQPDADIRRQVLAKIASGEATSYNEIVGGGHFSDYSTHPNVAVPQPDGTVSHAAGLYQFQPGTFGPIAKRLGLKDFSPASQDAAAWDLAQTEYKKQTGRDIVADAKQDKVDWSALGGQWTSLRGGGQATPGPGAAIAGSGGAASSPGGVASPAVAGFVPSGMLQNLTPEMMYKMAALQAIAPMHRFTQVNYDPFKVMPDIPIPSPVTREAQVIEPIHTTHPRAS
jgi:muramidase (phage lysozyme)